MYAYLERLNNNQYEAATNMDGFIRILAGAGSGKTATLIARVAYMIDQGISPKNILLVTFTNKAAKEMQDRVSKMIGEAANEITACTFHSFCANILRKNIHLLGLSRDFNIIDSTDAKDAMSISRQEFLDSQKKKGCEYNLKDFPNIREICSVHEWAINSCAEISDVIMWLGLNNYKAEIKEIIEIFTTYKRDRNILDYDDLLYYVKVLFETNDTIRSLYDQQFKYIMVDEYQDTSKIQSEIMHLIVKDFPNYCICGDDQQSIYSWRCAEIRNIIDFDKKYPLCKTIILDENYRSSQEILDLANAVTYHATEGIQKKLHGQFNKCKPKLVKTYDNYQENDFIINKIKELCKSGKKYSDIAIMIRSAKQSYGLETLLNSNGIPYEKFGGVKFLEKPAIKDILAFVRCAVNDKDELAYFRLLQLYPGLGVKFSKTISSEIVSHDFNYVIDKYKKRKFNQYLVELNNKLNYLKGLNVQEQLNELIENSYYKITRDRTILLANIDETKKIEYYREVKQDVEDSRALIDLASKYRSPVSFLTDLTLDATIQNNSDEDKLNITTIHSAKGLEYDVVFLMDAIKGHFPRCDEDDDQYSEELRAMYVAITRPRYELYIMFPSLYRTAYSVECSKLSPLLDKENILECIQLV